MPNIDWNTLKPGDKIPSFVRSTNLAHWNRYAAINDEFIPIHMDPADAKAVGMPDVFGMGNLRLAYLHNVLHDWLGNEGDIFEINCQFRGMNFKGDRLEVTGEITGKREEDGHQFIDLKLGVYNQRGEDTTPATATVILYKNGKGIYPIAPPPLQAPQQKPAPGKYLDQQTIAEIGKATAPLVALPVGANDIRRWAIATYFDEKVPDEYYFEKVAEHGPWRGLVAPRDLNPFVWMPDMDMGASEPWLMRRGMGITPGTRVLNGGQRNRYYAPIRANDVITCVATLAEARESEGKLGTMLFLVNETRWTNQRNELVRIGNRTTIYY